MAGNISYWIDVLDSAGNKVGGGPIVTATRWDTTARLNRAGEISFALPASDPMAVELTPHRRVECYTIIGDAVTLVGSGIIMSKMGVVRSNSATMLTVTGMDMAGELRWRSVGNLSIDDGAGGPDVTGPADIIALAPTGWALDTTNGYSSTATSVLHTYNGESVLQAFVRLAELTGERWRVGSGRSIVWLRTDAPDSGILLTNANPTGGSNPGVGYITSLRATNDAADIISRVYPHGNDPGTGRITLAGATWTPPSGYTLDAANNYLRRDTTETTYGRIDRWMVWDDIGDADTLAKAAYAELLRRGDLVTSYEIDIAGLQTVLLPGQTVRVLYHEWRDGYHVSSIDDPTAPGQGAPLVITETRTRLDSTGLRTVHIRASNVDVFSADDADIIVEMLRNNRKI